MHPDLLVASQPPGRSTLSLLSLPRVLLLLESLSSGAHGTPLQCWHSAIIAVGAGRVLVLLLLLSYDCPSGRPG